MKTVLPRSESAPAVTPGTPRQTSARRGPRLGQRRTSRRRTRKPSGSGHRIDRNRAGSPAGARAKQVSEILRQQVQKDLGIRVTAMRKARGWPQDVLARKCGISPGTLGQIERGHQDFHMLSLVSIAKGLETTVADLLMGIG